MRLPSFIFLSVIATFLVSAQTLKACANFLTVPNGNRYILTRGIVLGPYLQCDYFFDEQNGSSTSAYCFYRTSDYALSHYPHTSLPVDSNPGCVDPLPNAPAAGQYHITVPTSPSGIRQCAIVLGSLANGAKVGIKTCDGRHNYPNQIWTFDGYAFKQGNFCLDVTNGNNANGVKLQVWTCGSGNANQQFSHAGGNLLFYPNDRFTWVGKNKCVDLTGGSVADSNPLQIWDCDPANTNQKWTLQVHHP
ncbi:ricin B lectin domain-containing protein [Flagelloscypha sp. PMI_526]|nr:ricin B lectin domain-containing protein [Flagelloscypha sp. PMI_526]